MGDDSAGVCTYAQPHRGRQLQVDQPRSESQVEIRDAEKANHRVGEVSRDSARRIIKPIQEKERLAIHNAHPRDEVSN